MKRAVISLIVMGLASAPAFPRGEASEPGVVVVGIFGNVLGGIAGGLLAARMSRDEHGALPPVAIGALAGSVIGSALTVHWAAARRGSTRFGKRTMSSLGSCSRARPNSELNAESCSVSPRSSIHLARRAGRPMARSIRASGSVYGPEQS